MKSTAKNRRQFIHFCSETLLFLTGMVTLAALVISFVHVFVRFYLGIQ